VDGPDTEDSGRPVLRRTLLRVSDLEIRPLTPTRLHDLAELFGQGGDPRWCWCASFRLRTADFRRDPETNRKVLENALSTVATEQRAPGLIAYRREGAVGWTSLGPRSDYVRLDHSRILAPVDDKDVWSIVCFVVSRHARGEGVAKALLDGAIAYAGEHGALCLEGYPIENEGRRIPAANTYMGTLAMFESAGFEVVERRRATPNTIVRPIVRKYLRSA